MVEAVVDVDEDEELEEVVVEVVEFEEVEEELGLDVELSVIVDALALVAVPVAKGAVDVEKTPEPHSQFARSP